jgi:hypothetical protein
MSNPSSQRAKPTADTKFHIDYEWWGRESRDLRAYLISHLPTEQRHLFDSGGDAVEVDFIDPETAEVRNVDALQQALASAAQDANFITEHTTLVDALFRVFLANGNKPLSANELGTRTHRPATTILKTLTGAQVYKGIRPHISAPTTE